MAFTGQLGTADSQLGNIELASSNTGPGSSDVSLSIDGTSAVSLAGILNLVAAQSISGTCAVTPSLGTIIQLVRSIDGTAAFFSPGAGFVHTLQRSIEGICNISLLEGFSYERDFSIDGEADISEDYVYLMLEAFSIDATADIAIEETGFIARNSLTIAGTSAFTVATDGSWNESLTLGATGHIFFDKLYEILLLSVVTSTFTAAVTKTAPGDQNPSATGSFSAVGQCVFRRPVIQVLALVQTVTLKKPTWSSTQSLALTQITTCQKIHVEAVTHTLSMTQEVRAVRAISQTLSLSQTATCVRVQSRALAHTLSLTHSVARTSTLARSLAHTLIFNPPNVQRLPLVGSQNQTTNRQFEYYVPTVYPVLVPIKCLLILGVPSQTIILPCPIWGDHQNYQGEINLKRAMTGLTYTYVKKSRTQKLHYSFELWTSKYLELRQYFLDHAEELMTLQNHNAETWLVFMTNNPVEFTTEMRWQPKGEKYNVTLEFEGVKIGG